MREPPAGAWLCDALCFPRAVAVRERWLHEQRWPHAQAPSRVSSLIEPEPEPQHSSSVAGAQWAEARAARVDMDVAASLSQLHAEWMSQRPASSPVQRAGDIDANCHAERLSVDEWCRIGARCGLHVDSGMRHGLEGIARRHEYHTLSYDAVAGWYSTYMKRTMLSDDGTRCDQAPLSCIYRGYACTKLGLTLALFDQQVGVVLRHGIAVPHQSGKAQYTVERSRPAVARRGAVSAHHHAGLGGATPRRAVCARHVGNASGYVRV